MVDQAFLGRSLTFLGEELRGFLFQALSALYFKPAPQKFIYTLAGRGSPLALGNLR